MPRSQHSAQLTLGQSSTDARPCKKLEVQQRAFQTPCYGEFLSSLRRVKLSGVSRETEWFPDFTFVWFSRLETFAQ